jgi:hypothetical protein
MQDFIHNVGCDWFVDPIDYCAKDTWRRIRHILFAAPNIPGIYLNETINHISNLFDCLQCIEFDFMKHYFRKQKNQRWTEDFESPNTPEIL